MKNSKRNSSRKQCAGTAVPHRLRLEDLEDRLPLGDALVGALLAGSWAGSSLLTAPEGAAAVEILGQSATRAKAPRAHVPAERTATADGGRAAREGPP